MFHAVDIVAYIGTVILLVATQAPKRWQLHAIRIFGLILWLVYGIAIQNLPVILVEGGALIAEAIAIIRFGNDKN